MKIAFTRIDDRLIHGQVVTSWAKQGNIDRIIIVNDQVAGDELRIKLLKKAVPNQLKVNCVTIEKFAKVYQNPSYENDRAMVLAPSPLDILAAAKLGVPFEAVNVGNIGYKEGRTKVNNAIFLTQEEADALKALQKEYHVALDNRIMVGTSSEDIVGLIAKVGL